MGQTDRQKVRHWSRQTVRKSDCGVDRLSERQTRVDQKVRHWSRQTVRKSDTGVDRLSERQHWGRHTVRKSDSGAEGVKKTDMKPGLKVDIADSAAYHNRYRRKANFPSDEYHYH